MCMAMHWFTIHSRTQIDPSKENNFIFTGKIMSTIFVPIFFHSKLKSHFSKVSIKFSFSLKKVLAIFLLSFIEFEIERTACY